MRKVFDDMAEEFFFCQNSYGNTTRFKIFYTQKIFSVTVPGPGRYPNQKLLRYDQRSSNMILGKRENFGESKLLWAYNGLKFIFKRFFRLCEVRSKSCFILARNKKITEFASYCSCTLS